MALDMQSIYVLASGASRAMEQLDTVTNNLANVNTTGFKKMVIKEMSQRLDENGGDANHLFVFPRFDQSLIDRTQGPLTHTQNPLDLAIDGDGYFVVRTQNGPLYTRDGHFFLNEQGVLVDNAGNAVMDSQNKRVVLDPKVSFSVSEDGSIFQNGEVVAKLSIKNFDKMEPIGDTYYKPSGKETAADFRIKQGFLERSNINAVTEMSGMIVAHRRFEIYNTLIKSLDQINQKTNEIAKA